MGTGPARPQPGQLGSGSYGVGDVDSLTFASFAPQNAGPTAAEAPFVDFDNYDLMGTPREVGVVGKEGARGAWGIAQSLAGSGANNGEVNRIKNQLLALNPELADGVQSGQRYYVPGADTPENIALARSADQQYQAALAARAQAQAASLLGADGMRIGPTIERSQVMGLTSDASAVLAGGGAYPEMRAPAFSARQTAVDWVSSVVGTSRAGNVVAGAVDAWLATPEMLANVPDAVAAIPSGVGRLADSAASAAARLWNDPLGTVADTMASGVDGFRTAFNRTVNGNGFAMGSALVGLGTAGVPLGRAEGMLGLSGAADTYLLKSAGVPNTGVAFLDAAATSSSSFAQKLDAIRRAGFEVVPDTNLAARGEFSVGKFTYNPDTMTRLDMAHEWRHFGQLQQMADNGIGINNKAFGIAQSPAEYGAYRYEERLWSRIGANPSAEYLRFHNSQLDTFESGLGSFRSFAAKPYNAKWRGIAW